MYLYSYVHVYTVQFRSFFEFVWGWSFKYPGCNKVRTSHLKVAGGLSFNRATVNNMGDTSVRERRSHFFLLQNTQRSLLRRLLWKVSTRISCCAVQIGGYNYRIGLELDSWITTIQKRVELSLDGHQGGVPQSHWKLRLEFYGITFRLLSGINSSVSRVSESETGVGQVPHKGHTSATCQQIVRLNLETLAIGQVSQSLDDAEAGKKSS